MMALSVSVYENLLGAAISGLLPWLRWPRRVQLVRVDADFLSQCSPAPQMIVGY